MPRHALVLAAGLGTRLRPLTLVRAKPAIPVAGEPMIRRIVSWLAAHGVTDIVVNLHHRPETIAAVLGDGSDLAVHVRYSWEQPAVLGSAGGPRHALPLIDGDPFFIVNGDTLTDFDLGTLRAAHAASGALVTLAVIPNREPERYGGVRLGEDGVVQGFVPRGSAARGSCHFIGVQLAQKAAFERLPDDEPIDSVGNLYDRLIVERPGSICGHLCSADFLDVGTTADYWRSSMALLGTAAGARSAGLNVQVDPTARVEDSILWNDIDIGPRSLIEQCIVTDGVQVSADSSYRQVVLFRRDDGGVTATPFDR
jgi:NDP-sugar pyrophosphorylase family protein